MRRFFLETLSPNISKGSMLDIPEDLLHRIKDVLRVNNGDVVEFIDGKGLLVKAEVTRVGKNSTFIVNATENIKNDRPLIGVAVSLIRRERFDLLVEKAVELGVDVIIPLETEYSRPFGKESYSKLTERWQKIADQALSQCKRLFRCKVERVMNIDEVIENKGFEEKVFFHFGGQKPDNNFVKKGRSHLFIIGPEGAFSPEEVTLLNDKGIKFYSLTDDILRTETAAFYVLSIANFLGSK